MVKKNRLCQSGENISLKNDFKASHYTLGKIINEKQNTTHEIKIMIKIIKSNI